MLQQRISLVATSLTVAVMFVLISFALRLDDVGVPLAVAGLVAAVLLSAGTYKVLAGLLTKSVARSLIVRRALLGKEFIEGTWIGHYVKDGAYRYTVEHIDQSTGMVSVEGTEYAADGAVRCTWTSDTAAVVDAQRRLVYAYRCTMFGAHTHQGLADFQLVRPKPTKAPDRLDGWAADLVDGEKDPNEEIKVSDSLLDKRAALERAKATFGVGAPGGPAGSAETG